MEFASRTQLDISLVNCFTPFFPTPLNVAHYNNLRNLLNHSGTDLRFVMHVALL